MRRGDRVKNLKMGRGRGQKNPSDYARAVVSCQPREATSCWLLAKATAEQASSQATPKTMHSAIGTRSKAGNIKIEGPVSSNPACTQDENRRMLSP